MVFSSRQDHHNRVLKENLHVIGVKLICKLSVFSLSTAPPALSMSLTLFRNIIFNDTKYHPLLNPILFWNMLFVSMFKRWLGANTVVEGWNTNLYVPLRIYTLHLWDPVSFPSLSLPVAAIGLFWKHQLWHTVPCSMVISRFLLGVGEEHGAGGPRKSFQPGEARGSQPLTVMLLLISMLPW